MLGSCSLHVEEKDALYSTIFFFLRREIPTRGTGNCFLFLFFFFFFFLKKISIFIYFLINLYFFIKMDTCHHLIGDT